MNLNEIIEQGISLAREGRYKAALDVFDQDICFTQNAAAMAYYALCLAEEERNFERALSLCLMAVEKEFYNPSIYLNLGRILLLNNQKGTAFKAFKKGLKFDDTNAEILSIVEKLGKRRRPVVSFLPRNNSLNRLLGILTSRLTH